MTTSEGARRGFGPRSAAISGSLLAGRHSRLLANATISSSVRPGHTPGSGRTHRSVLDVDLRADDFTHDIDGIVRGRRGRTFDAPEVAPQRRQTRLRVRLGEFHHDPPSRVLGERGDERLQVRNVVCDVRAHCDVRAIDRAGDIGPPAVDGVEVEVRGSEPRAARRACQRCRRPRSAVRLRVRSAATRRLRRRRRPTTFRRRAVFPRPLVGG